MTIDSEELLPLASEVLQSGEMDVVRIHEFELDGDEHDDEAIEQLYLGFEKNFEKAVEILSQQHGPAARSGKDDDEAIPLSGVMQFQIWELDEADLFLALSHEDRGVPILLMLGTSER